MSVNFLNRKRIALVDGKDGFWTSMKNNAESQQWYLRTYSENLKAPEWFVKVKGEFDRLCNGIKNDLEKILQGEAERLAGSGHY